VTEYHVPDRDGDGKDELIALVTTITDPRQAPAAALARARHQRWEHETGNAQLKACLRGPGKVGTAPARASSNAAGITPTASRNPATTAPGTTARPPSGSPTR
jgi:hypothetical protein